MESLRAEFLDALRRWAEETGEDARPLTLYALYCIGHPDGAQPLVAAEVVGPLAMAQPAALAAQLDRLVDQVGMAEAFIVASLARAVADRLRQGIDEGGRDLEILAALKDRFAALQTAPDKAAAYLAARGLAAADLQAALGQLDAEIARLSDGGWKQARQRDLDAWLRLAAPLVAPERQRAGMQERFEAASLALRRFFDAS